MKPFRCDVNVQSTDEVWLKYAVDQKVTAVTVDSSSLLIIFSLRVSIPTIRFCFTDKWTLICPSSTKIKLVNDYEKINGFTPHYLKKQPTCEQWLEVRSSLCDEVRKALDKECEPKYNMFVRHFWESNCGLTEDCGVFYFSITLSIKLNTAMQFYP